MKRLDKCDLPHMCDLASGHLLWDLHMHTTYVDGMQGVGEMVNAARNLGLQVIAITEHVRTSFGHWWASYVNEIRNVRRADLKVFIGMEANAIGSNGNIDVTPEMRRDAEIVLGAVHGYYNDLSWEKLNPADLSSEEALAYEIQKLEGLCENPEVHVLAHPFWLYGKYFGAVPADAVKRVARKAAITGTAYEINVRYIGDWEMTRQILLDCNPLVSVGSNAHDVAEIGTQSLAARLWPCEKKSLSQLAE